MTREELTAELREMASYASINQRYHQKMIERWSSKDVRVKILLAVVTVLSFACSLVGFVWGWFDVLDALLNIVAVAAALSLTYVAYDARERESAEAFARWTYLYQDITTTLARLRMTEDDHVLCVAERVPEFKLKISEIEKTERAPDRNLLDQVQGDETEWQWGGGIRTDEQIRAEQARRLAAAPAPVPQPAALSPTP